MDFGTFREPQNFLRAPSSKSGAQAAQAGPQGDGTQSRRSAGASWSSRRFPRRVPLSVEPFWAGAPDGVSAQKA